MSKRENRKERSKLRIPMKGNFFKSLKVLLFLLANHSSLRLFHLFVSRSAQYKEKLLFLAQSRSFRGQKPQSQKEIYIEFKLLYEQALHQALASVFPPAFNTGQCLKYFYQVVKVKLQSWQPVLNLMSLLSLVEIRQNFHWKRGQGNL